MKLNVKRSLGKLDHLNVRIPTALKRRLEALRKRAENLNIDYTATLVATLDEFAAELEAKMDSEGIPQESPANLSNGSSPERA
jgi:hypothetical protein